MKKLLSIALLTGSLIFSGCGDSENYVFTNTNTNNQPTPVVAPVCEDDAYSTNRNVALSTNALNGVLANDEPNGGTVTFQATGTSGGTVAGNADGSFVYTPPVNFAGSDTFTYTVTNSAGSTTCTVTIDVVAVDGFYVDAQNGNDGTGSFTGGMPFETAQAAVTAAGPNQDIIVRPGTYNESVTLLDGQRLLGNGSGLVVNPQGFVRPTFTGQIILADGNTVDFIRIDGFAGDGIEGNDNNGGTITDCEIVNLPIFAFGINVTSATGNWTISNNIITATGFAIGVTSEAGDNFVGSFDSNVCTNNQNGAIGFSIGGNALVKAMVTNNTMTGTVAAGSTFQVIISDTVDFCARITGNINDDAYEFSNDNTNAELRVEQFSQLEALNSGGATVEIGLGSVENPVEGSCNF